MKKVGKRLIHISIIFLLTILTLSTSFVSPAPAAAQSVSFQTLAAGTKYATKLYIIRSNNPGPVVMFVGGVHGNEPAGYKAANIVKDYTIKKGTLLVIPNANLPADRIGNRTSSGSFDLNRCFPRTSRESADNVLSKAIYSAVKRYDVDWLVDMHEGVNYTSVKSSSSVGQSLIYYPDSATRNISQRIVSSLNQNISTSYKKFSLLTYPVQGSLSRASGQFLGVNTFIFETCSRQLLSTRVGYQLKAAGILLSSLGMR
ncbi:MAG: succinylglutamate desuccinylase/aspartoacylase family protein [Syntrophomonas sp.]